MQINFVVFNSFGGGNKNLYLLHEEAKNRNINSKYIILSNNKIKNKSYFLKIKIYFFFNYKMYVFIYKISFFK